MPKSRMTFRYKEISTYVTLESFIKELNKFVKEHPEVDPSTTSPDLHMEWDSPIFRITYYSPETDEEKQSRLDQEKRIREIRLKQYEALKREFEK